MGKDNVEKRRSVVRSQLGEITDVVLELNKAMSDVRRNGPTSRLSLKPQSGEFVVQHFSGSVLAQYQHANGKWYELQFRNIDGYKSK